MVLHFPGQTYFSYLVIEGNTLLTGPGLITVDRFLFRGGVLQVDTNVKNLNLSDPRYNIGEGAEPYSFEDCDIVVSDYIISNQTFEYPLLMNNSRITVLPGVTWYGEGSTLAGADGWITNYGTLDIVQTDSGAFTCYVPIQNYGTIICEDGVFSGLLGGGVNNGTIVSYEQDVYGNSASIETCFFGDTYGKGWTFLPGTQFPNGFVESSGYFSSSDCGHGFPTGGCYGSGVWNVTFNTTIPDFFMTKTGVLHVPEGVEVVLGNAYLAGGVIDGAGSVYVKNGSFCMFYEGANSLYISDTNLYIDGPFQLEVANFVFINGGNMTFTENANVTATISLSDSGTDKDNSNASPNSQILNYGNFYFYDTDGTGDGSVKTPLTNYGNITLGGLPGTHTQAATWTFNVPLNQAGNGALVVRVFSQSDADLYIYEVGQDFPCPIEGSVILNFLYTPKVGDSIIFMTYQRYAAGYTECTGYFSNVITTGLPDSMKVNIMYDNSFDTYHDYRVLAIVCDASSTNSTCTTHYTAGGATYTTSGQSSTTSTPTGGQSTTSATTGGEPTSPASSTKVVVYSLLFILVTCAFL